MTFKYTEIMEFVKNKAMVGWAPTQGHIPSGVPYLGFAIDDLTKGTANRAMIVCKLVFWQQKKAWMSV